MVSRLTLVTMIILVTVTLVALVTSYNLLPVGLGGLACISLGT